MSGRRYLQVGDSFDDDAQVDGDASVPFVPNSAGQPWLRGGVPPWHLWGNTERLTITSDSFGAARVVSGQLNKISYKRPDTWHWFFGAKLISGPTVASPQEAGVRIHFDVTIGVGRSFYQIPSFETLQWVWSDPGGGPVPTPPTDVLLYSTTAVAPNRSYNNATPPAAVENRINEIVAQDIQVQLRLEGLSNFPNTIVVDVTGFWSPKTHVRPEWLLGDRVPPEAKFPGNEIGGS